MSAPKDELLERLRTAHPHIGFAPATDPVVEGADLRASGNRRYGANVYVATHDPPAIDPAAHPLGRTLAPGAVEAFAHAELRCAERGGHLEVAVYDRSGRRLTRMLRAPAGADEAEFAWLGPLEDICTPWSDNDPPQCQVVSVDRLREYARTRTA